jgi:hypothetical protein
MQILQFQNKGAHLNTIEKFYTYKEFSENNHLNDEQNISPNKILDTILKSNQPVIKPPPHTSSSLTS